MGRDTGLSMNSWLQETHRVQKKNTLILVWNQTSGAKMNLSALFPRDSTRKFSGESSESSWSSCHGLPSFRTFSKGSKPCNCHPHTRVLEDCHLEFYIKQLDMSRPWQLFFVHIITALTNLNPCLC